MARKNRIDATTRLTGQRRPRSAKPVGAASVALPGDAAGSSSLRHASSKGGKPAAEQFPLKLTKGQREALAHASRLKPAIRRKIEAVEATQPVLLTPKELGRLAQECAAAALFAPQPDKRQLVAAQQMVFDLLEAVAERPRSTPRRPVAADSAVLFQFKITLLNSEPAIWRRIQVEDCDLAELHDHLQAAFGWEDYHMHGYEIAGERYGPTSDDDVGLRYDSEMGLLDESSVMLGDLLPNSRKRAPWIYEYDFGDGWRHEIVFEGRAPKEKGQKYPRCTEGARACPPEDCGGPWGYAELLEALADPQHERHEEFMVWCGRLKPEAFDPAKATRQMRKQR